MMKVAEYRDLITAVQEAVTSCRSCASVEELDKEIVVLDRRFKELNNAPVHPRANAHDIHRKDVWNKLAVQIFNEQAERNASKPVEAEPVKMWDAYIREYSDQTLATFVKSAVDFRASGVLENDSPIRKWVRDYTTKTGTPLDIYVFIDALFHEAGVRFVKANS